MTKFDKVLDSGKATTSASGAQYDPAGAETLDILGILEWLPVEALRRVKQHYINGAKKRSKDNWRKGIPARVCLDKAARHLYQYIHGDRAEDHLSAVVFWMFTVLVWEETGRTDLLTSTASPLPGSWAWAKEQMAQGYHVSRRSGVNSHYRLRTEDGVLSYSYDGNEYDGKWIPIPESMLFRTNLEATDWYTLPYPEEKYSRGDWAWACRQMDQGKTVWCPRFDWIRFRREGNEYWYVCGDRNEKASPIWSAPGYEYEVADPCECKK